MDPVVELSVIEVKSFYALMDDTSISENLFLDTEEPQVQPNTSAGTHVYLTLFNVSIKINIVLHMCYDSILWDWWLNEVTTNRMTIVIIKVIITRSFVRCYQDHVVYYQLARSVCQKLNGTNFHRKRKHWWTHAVSNLYMAIHNLAWRNIRWDRKPPL